MESKLKKSVVLAFAITSYIFAVTSLYENSKTINIELGSKFEWFTVNIGGGEILKLGYPPDHTVWLKNDRMLINCTKKTIMLSDGASRTRRQMIDYYKATTPGIEWIDNPNDFASLLVDKLMVKCL